MPRATIYITTLCTYDHNIDARDLLLKTAFGYNTLYIPLMGQHGNIGNIDARMLQSFILYNITPKKCLIVASGVKNQTENEELVKERLGDGLAVPEHENTRKVPST